MFKRLLTLQILLILFLSASSQSQSEIKAAESFFFAIKNDVSSLFELQVSEKTDKKALLDKFETLINNIESSNMDFSKLNYSWTLAEKLDGLNASILVIVYSYENKLYDDLFILLEANTYKILEIGSPEKAFQRNDALNEKNIRGIQSLSRHFFPNLPSKFEAIEAAKRLIKLAKEDKLEELTPLIAYRGTEDPTRKNLAGPLNYKNAQDKTKASNYMSDIRHTFSSHESVSLIGSFTIYQHDGSCYLRLICNDNKNTGDFRFVLRDGKYLMSEFD